MNGSEGNAQENFDLKMFNYSHKTKEMILFENYLCNLANKFQKTKRNLQRQLNEDIKVIRQSNKVLVFAIKTCNICKVDTDEYEKLTTQAVTSTYKIVPHKINDKVNIENKMIMESVTALYRTFINGKNSCFIIPKNHK